MDKLLDNKLVVLGFASMIAVMLRGIWLGTKGREIESNRFAFIRSALGVATLSVFGFYAYMRRVENDKLIMDRQKRFIEHQLKRNMQNE